MEYVKPFHGGTCVLNSALGGRDVETVMSGRCPLPIGMKGDGYKGRRYFDGLVDLNKARSPNFFDCIVN